MSQPTGTGPVSGLNKAREVQRWLAVCYCPEGKWLSVLPRMCSWDSQAVQSLWGLS